jgi:hypothetical protein
LSAFLLHEFLEATEHYHAGSLPSA